MSPAENIDRSKQGGPRTPAGKERSSHNALRHGLTGRIVVLPSEDLNVYNAFCKEIMAELAPETALERQHAQTFCDTQWRLNRARSIEDSMLALGHFEHADSLSTGDPQVLAALTAAKAFRQDSKSFVNLTLYEQRLQRTQKEALRQLEELQARRLALQKVAAKEKAEKSCPNKQKTKENQFVDEASEFVFSTAGVAQDASRQNRESAPPAALPNEAQAA